MKDLPAYCGILCRTCPIYLATRESDLEKQRRMRVEIARQIARHYGTPYDPESVTDCDGCGTADGRLFSGCRDCSIRRCADGKGLASCAYCEEYACKNLLAFFSADPQAQKRLEEIRSTIH